MLKPFRLTSIRKSERGVAAGLQVSALLTLSLLSSWLKLSHRSLCIVGSLLPQWGTADTGIRVPSVDNPGHSPC